MAFQVLDREWLAMRASYMDFPSVMKKAERSMERALSSQPESLQLLQRLLEVSCPCHGSSLGALVEMQPC